MVNDPTPPEQPVHTRARRGKVLVETMVVLSAVVAFEHFVLRRPLGSFRSHPHPYWLAVLPLAASRGMIAGLMAAAGASLLYAIGVREALEIESVRALFDRELLSEPCLFLAVGFLVGEMHDVVLDRHHGMLRQVATADATAARHRRERDALRTSIRLLSTRMVDASVQFAEAAEVAERLEGAPESDAFALALELVDEHCGAVASILIPRKDGVDVAAARGWHADERAGRLAAARSSPLVHRALREGVMVNGLAPSEETPRSGPLMAVPLLGAEGVVRAVLAIDDIPLYRVDPTTVDTISAVAAWVAGALRRADRGGAADNEADATSLSVGSPDDLRLRLCIEAQRGLRYGVPHGLVVVQLPDVGRLDARGRRRLDARVVPVLSRSIRTGDGLFEMGLPGCFVIVAMDAVGGGVDVVAGRLRTRLAPDVRTGQPAPLVDAYDADTVGRDVHAVLDEIARLASERADVPMRSTRPFDVPDQVPAGDADAFWTRLNTEASLAMRRGDTFHVVQISVEHADRDDGHLLRRLNRVTRSQLRPLDTPYVLGPGHAAVVLPYTDREAAEQIAERLVEAIAELDSDAPYGTLSAEISAGLQASGDGAASRAAHPGPSEAVR